MSVPKKPMSVRDSEQALRSSYNENNTLGVDGFIVGAVGRQIAPVTSQTNVANDTVTFNFSEDFGNTPLYAIQIVYTDGSQQTILTVTRIS